MRLHQVTWGFDGASSGRCGGVTLDTDGKKIMEFLWGLGPTTNNNAKRWQSKQTSGNRGLNLIIKGLQRNIKNTHPPLPQYSHVSKNLRKDLRGQLLPCF
jgi:hypothetical protein